MIRSFKTEGIVIKRRNFGELDRILSVFTKTNGKIQVRAPGVRRITSRRSSHIELLNFSILTLYKSPRSLLPILTEAQTLEEFLPIKNNLPKVGFSYYICELINRLCPENQENRRIFFLVRDTMFKLCNYSSSDQAKPESREVWSLNSSRQARTISLDSIIENFEDEFLVMLGFLPKFHKVRDRQAFIEEILESKLTTKRLLPLFLG